jgi:DNA polymerase-3 subunit gamma/tau
VLYSIALHGRAELALAPDEYSGLMMVLLRLLAFRPQGAVAVAAPMAPVVPRAVPPVAAVRLVAPVASSRELLRPVAASTRVAVAPGPVPVPAPAPVVAKPVPNVAAKPSGVAPWEEGPPADWDDIPLEGDPAPVRAAVPVPLSVTPADPTADLDDPLVTRWAALFGELAARGSINGLVRELAWQAQCLSMDEQAAPKRVVLRVERESLRQSGHRDRLQAALSEMLEEPVALEVVAGAVSDSPARRDTARRLQAQNDAEAALTSDPLVLELLARYPTARIVPGSIRPVV